MTLEEIKYIVQPYIDEPIKEFAISREIFLEVTGRKLFNKTVRSSVARKAGVYLWIDEPRAEIVYIGKAGSIGNDGMLKEHSMQERLTASRGKDKITYRDIQTNDYVKAFMSSLEIPSLSIIMIYSKDGEPPAYIEALLLYHFYKKNGRLPKLNNSY